MSIVIQDLDDESTRGLSLAFHLSGLNLILWNPSLKSIFDLFSEAEPVLLIIYSSYYREHSEELRAAQLKYGGTVFVVGMEFDDQFTLGRTIAPFANIIDSIAKIEDRNFKSDVSMILNYIRPNDMDYVHDIINTVQESNLSFRIYGSVKVDSPHYVGRIKKGDNQKIYNNSNIHIDLYGEHYLTPFLYGSLGICELQYHYFGQAWHNAEDLTTLGYKLKEFGQKKIYMSDVIVDIFSGGHTNFDSAARILGTAGLIDASLAVLDKKKDIIDEFWSGGRNS